MKIPFCSGSYLDRSPDFDPEICQNLFIKIDKQEGKEVLSLHGVPGLVPTGSIEITIDCWDGDSLSCFYNDPADPTMVWPPVTRPDLADFGPPPVGAPIMFWGVVRNPSGLILNDVWIESNYAGWASGTINPGQGCDDFTIVPGIFWRDTDEAGTTRRKLNPSEEIEFYGWYAPPVEECGLLQQSIVTTHAWDELGNEISKAQPEFPGCTFFCE